MLIKFDQIFFLFKWEENTVSLSINFNSRLLQIEIRNFIFCQEIQTQNLST